MRLPRKSLNPEPDPDPEAMVRLVRAAQAGDRASFATLLARYQRAVYGTAIRRLGCAIAARELCQEVAIQAMRKIHQLKDPRCFGAWLRSIANRLAINRIVRRRRQRSLHAEDLVEHASRSESPLSYLLAQEAREQVHQGLARLGPLDRDTLVAFYFEGQSLDQMSGVFGTPVGTIKRRLHVARKRLAKQLAALAPA